MWGEKMAERNAVFSVYTEDGACAGHLSAPLVEMGGRELALSVKGRTDEACVTYEGSAFLCRDILQKLGGGVYRLLREVQNTSRCTVTFKLITELETAFVPAKYNIPCVSYSGNEASSGGEPKGLCKDGERWIFAYDRTGIPSCTEAESDSLVTALFASDADKQSLESSCSLDRCADGRMRHRIWYPVTEAPYTYSDKDLLSPRYDGYITLRPTEKYTVTAFVYAGVPKWKNYGMASVLDAALDLFDNLHDTSLAPELVRECSLAWSGFLVRDVQGVKMFSNMYRHSEHDDGLYAPYQIYEAGWSGQCMQQARQFILEYKRTGEKKYLDIGLSCFDGWMETQTECGLFPTNYIRHINRNFVPCDVCNFSWGVIECVRAYRLLRELGIERERYVEFARRILDFLISRYTDELGFGRSYTVYGEKVSDGGSVGGFVCMALVEFYELTGEERYLCMAKRSYDRYFGIELEEFICTAGALDCTSIDKETAYPFIYTALRLYGITGEDKYLVCAQKAAYYFFSWAYHYDALYPDDSDFAKYGYYTSGGTAVSTQHHAIDPWGEIAVPDFARLAEILGDDRWKKRAKMMWNNAILCITTDREGDVKLGHRRPFGAQSEAFFGCRWTKYRPTCEERGHINDMFVGWVSAYRLSALERIEYMCREGLDLLRPKQTKS